MRLRSILFAVAVALTVVGASDVYAQQVRDGSTTPTPAISFWPMGGTDGTYNRVMRLDSDGVLKVMEAYKNNAQYYWGTLLSLGRVNTGFVDSTAVWDNAGVYKDKYLEIAAITDTTTAGVDSVVIYPMASMDGSVYTVILSPSRFNLGANVSLDAALDTVRIVVKTASAGDPASGGTGFWLPFFDYRNGMPFIWNYMKFKVKNMSGHPVKVRIRAAGRMN